MKNSIFLVENDPFFSKCSECINMHQNVSKCMQNELCKCFVHEIIKKVVLITFKGTKIHEIHLPLYGGTPCSISPYTFSSTCSASLLSLYLSTKSVILLLCVFFSHGITPNLSTVLQHDKLAALCWNRDYSNIFY